LIAPQRARRPSDSLPAHVAVPTDYRENRSENSQNQPDTIGHPVDGHWGSLSEGRQYTAGLERLRVLARQSHTLQRVGLSHGKKLAN